MSECWRRCGHSGPEGLLPSSTGPLKQDPLPWHSLHPWLVAFPGHFMLSPWVQDQPSRQVVPGITT